MLALVVDAVGLAVGDGGEGVGVELLDEGLQECGVCDVVAFSDPDVFALGGLDASVPLDEGAAGVGVVEQELDVWQVCVGLDDLSAVVGGAVVEDEDVEVAVGLVEYAVDALAEVVSVVVVGDDDSDVGHGVLAGGVGIIG